MSTIIGKMFSMIQRIQLSNLQQPMSFFYTTQNEANEIKKFQLMCQST